MLTTVDTDTTLNIFSWSNILMWKGDEQVIFLNTLCYWRSWTP